MSSFESDPVEFKVADRIKMILPGPNRVGTMPNPGLQDPGLHTTGQDPGPPPGHVPAPPVFYLPPPPLPPLLHYQWPMPFFCNPFAGLPGMGYGMAVPPFPSPLYMEAPTYILPQSHIQAVDHRRLLHPQAHAPFTPLQNPNQPRRGRPPPPPHVVPRRETVNCEVQTEPISGTGYGSGALVVNSDSGHGTASNSSSSSSSSTKKVPDDIQKYPPSSNADDFQFNRNLTSTTVKHHKCTTRAQPHSRATVETQQSCNGRLGQEKILSCRNGHCDMWSVSSQDSIIPICSSFQQESEAAKERRGSIPDILMSWGGPTPQSTQPKPQCEQWQLSSKTEKSLCQNTVEIQADPLVAHSPGSPYAQHVFSSTETDALFKIVKLPAPLCDLLSDTTGEEQLLDSNGSLKHCPPCTAELFDSCNDERTMEREAEVISSQITLSSCLSKGKTNESIWSVESLAPYIPSKGWLLQNGMTEPDVIAEEPESCQGLRDSDMERHFIFRSPGGQSPVKKTDSENEGYAFKIIKKKQANQNHRSSPETRGDESPLTSEQVDDKRSSEPEAYQSPNQELLILKRIQESIQQFSEEEGTDVLSTATEEGSLASDHQEEEVAQDAENVCSVRNEQLCVPVAEDEMDVMLLKNRRGRLVDLGVQCENVGCFCGKAKGSGKPVGRPLLPSSDLKKGSKERDDGGVSGHVQRKLKYNHQGKIRGGTGNRSSKQRGLSGFYSKPGKTQGATRRTPQC
ncbi:uncharacterized protein LOC103396640 isoform X2 [Cynoglossus semilaevis]|uniref:uncharacterized protein LOC103396640 isoform X2 n=1 Tax=Cynoglossus semilaevis TaxID=244447 RepID=UPI0004954D70|nr:uncharacterized protein LOC103396640 isoform X2 [Cynoglossus semilaevis]